MSQLLRDVRQAVRGLRGRSSVALFVVLTYGLGIGITTAVFTLFHGVLLRPLPYPDPDRLVMIFDVQPACDTCPASFTKLDDWIRGSASFEAIAGSSGQQVVVTGVGDPERISSAPSTWQLPLVFGVQPAIGRFYNEEEDQPGGPDVVVLSHGYWARALGSDATVVGQRITIDGVSREILGVMPASYRRAGDVLLPVQMAPDPGQRGNHWLRTYARLRDDVSVEQARQEMVALGERLQQEFGHNHGIDVQSYPEIVTGNISTPLRVLMGAVSLVLLIACANVANLLLASGLARRRELAVRAALGATRWDLTRQLTVESVVLALAGGGLGLFIAQWAVATFIVLASDVLPSASSLGIDGTVVAFAAVLSLATGILCGLWPVVRLGRRAIGGDMRESDVRTGSAAGGQRFGNGLVVAEVALACCLLIGAGLLIRNLLALEARVTGFETERRVAFDIAPTGPRYADREQRMQLYRDLQARFEAIPSVERVGSTSHLPMYQFGWNGEVYLESGNPWQPDVAPLVEFRWVGGDYFQTMGIRLLSGRLLDENDREGTAQVTVINRRAAEMFWPGGNPLGRRFSRGSPENDPYEVVGVVEDVRGRGLLLDGGYEMYIPIGQDTFQWQTFVLHASAEDPLSVIPQARAIVGEVDPQLPVSEIQTLSAVVSESVNQPRLVSSLALLFGALAALLAAVGVYGVMAYNVRRQRREFGIRLALGADPARVQRLVALRGAVLGALGVAIGTGAALVLTRYIESLLNDVQPRDPVAYLASAAGLLTVTVLAGYLPARQASKTDPMVVLRLD